MGAKTPIALVTSTTNSVPIRRGTSYSRSWVPHDFELLLLDSDSPAPTQCLLVSKRLTLTQRDSTYSTPAWKWQLTSPDPPLDSPSLPPWLWPCSSDDPPSAPTSTSFPWGSMQYLIGQHIIRITCQQIIYLPVTSMRMTTRILRRKLPRWRGRERHLHLLATAIDTVDV